MTAGTVRARRAVAALFVLNGAVLASWVPHIPAVKRAHGLGDAQLGALLLCIAAGAVASLSVTGWLVGRFGSRRVSAAAAVGLSAALPLPIISPTVPLLALSLALFGACNGALDVSMNAQALLVEQQYRRPIMSAFHGLFGVGGVLGAGAASAFMLLGVSSPTHVLLVAAIGFGVVVAVRAALLPDAVGRADDSPRLALPTGPLRWLALLAFAALMTEGAMSDWSAVYLHDVLMSTPALAGAAFAAFALMMAAGRFSGDRAVASYGAVPVLRASGTIAALGLALALTVDNPAVAVLGFALVGLGIANVIPVLFSHAGNLPDIAPGTALAATATAGYCGFLTGPPLIGAVAQQTSLSLALGIVVAACVLIVWLAPTALLRST